MGIVGTGMMAGPSLGMSDFLGTNSSKSEGSDSSIVLVLLKVFQAFKQLYTNSEMHITGPVIGGILVHFLGVRSIFWFLVILGAVFLIPYALTVPETGRNIVGNGSIPAQGWNMTFIEWLRLRKRSKNTNGTDDQRPTQASLPSRPKLRIPNPLKSIHIIMQKDAAAILFFNALVYTAFYDVMASMPHLFQEVYNFNDLQIGLCYIPLGIGCAIASFTNGKMMDYNYKRVAREVGFTVDRKRGDDLRHFPIERARIGILWV
jgi:MFS family permease